MPASVRDQLVRTHYLVHRMFAAGVLGPGVRLLVIGAGAAGVNAAVLAARLGARVLALDRSGISFATQFNCKTRWLDPAQYDWPLPRADEGQWPTPLDQAVQPLGFTAATAHEVARLWLTQLAADRRALGERLRVLVDAHEVTVGLGRAEGAQRVVSWRQGEQGLMTSEPFDVLLRATGARGEKTGMPTVALGGHASTFVGRKFWHDDRFESRDLGLPLPVRGLRRAPDKVLVSGAGDGGLQDYIRLTTGQPSALGVLRAVFAHMRGGRDLLGLIRRRALEAEAVARAALLWNHLPAQDHDALDALQRAYEGVLTHWRNRHAHSWRHAMDVLGRMTDGRQPQRVLLLHGCTHFGACYGLNRVVALLMIAFVEAKYQARPLLSRSRLDEVSPPVTGKAYAHVCDDLGCWGLPHQVQIRHGVTCRGNTSYGPSPLTVAGVVVRHGVEQDDDVVVRRQSVPYGAG